MARTGGDLLIDVFKSYGIEYIFSSPGTEWVPVWEGLAKLLARGEKTPRYINCRHEGLAVSLASGYARATGQLTAVLLHASIGPLHAAMEIRAAYRARTPAIICTGESFSFGDDEKGTNWQWLARLSDTGGADAGIKPYTKWSNLVTSRKSLLDSLYRGCQIARSFPQGPVFISIPWELLLEEFPSLKIAQPPPPITPSEPRSSDIEEIARQLIKSKNPVIITEYAGGNPRNVAKLVELAELLGIPVFEFLDPACTNFPPDHPLHMGYDALQTCREADLIFVIGSNTPWHPPSTFPPGEAKVILLDDNSFKEQMPYWGYRIDLSITADIAQSLTKLVDAVRIQSGQANRSGINRQERFEYWRTKHEQVMRKSESEACADQKNKPISTRWFLYLTNKLLPENSIILSEAVSHSMLLRRYLTRFSNHLRVSSGGLGTGLGVAAGVKLAHPDRPVVLFVGDGSFNYNPVLAGLGLYQEYNIPVLVIILNNHGYITMKYSHQNVYRDGEAVCNNTYFGVDITPDPEYARVAETFSAYGQKIEEPEDIEPAITKALKYMADGKFALLDVILSS